MENLTSDITEDINNFSETELPSMSLNSTDTTPKEEYSEPKETPKEYEYGLNENNYKQYLADWQREIDNLTAIIEKQREIDFGMRNKNTINSKNADANWQDVLSNLTQEQLQQLINDINQRDVGKFGISSLGVGHKNAAERYAAWRKAEQQAIANVKQKQSDLRNQIDYIKNNFDTRTDDEKRADFEWERNYEANSKQYQTTVADMLAAGINPAGLGGALSGAAGGGGVGNNHQREEEEKKRRKDRKRELEEQRKREEERLRSQMLMMLAMGAMNAGKQLIPTTRSSTVKYFY